MVGEWSWGGWWLRCLMWSGSVGIHKPSSELNSFTCMFPRFIVCYIKSLNKLLYQMFWWAAMNDWPAYIPLSQVICINFKGGGGGGGMLLRLNRAEAWGAVPSALSQLNSKHWCPISTDGFCLVESSLTGYSVHLSPLSPTWQIPGTVDCICTIDWYWCSEKELLCNMGT